MEFYVKRYERERSLARSKSESRGSGGAHLAKVLEMPHKRVGEWPSPYMLWTWGVDGTSGTSYGFATRVMEGSSRASRLYSMDDKVSIRDIIKENGMYRA